MEPFSTKLSRCGYFSGHSINSPTEDEKMCVHIKRLHYIKTATGLYGSNSRDRRSPKWCVVAPRYPRIASSELELAV